MIDFDFLATAINEMLGTDKCIVFVNTNANPIKEDSRTVVTMSAARIPFAYVAVFSPSRLRVISLSVSRLHR